MVERPLKLRAVERRECQGGADQMAGSFDSFCRQHWSRLPWEHEFCVALVNGVKVAGTFNIRPSMYVLRHRGRARQHELYSTRGKDIVTPCVELDNVLGIVVNVVVAFNRGACLAHELNLDRYFVWHLYKGMP